MNDLFNNPDIQELLTTLEENGLTKEKSEVNSLVSYIGEMEKTLDAMLTEMQEMRKDVSLIHDSSLRAKCTTLIQNADSTIRKGIAAIGKAKENFIESAKNAVATFKTNGKEALKTAMRRMMIPETLDKLGDLFHKFSKSVEKDSENLKTAHDEFESSKHHLSNAVRGLFGKEPKEEAETKADKGILSKLSKFNAGLGKSFASLEKKTMDLADKIRVDRVKASVKADLNFFKEESTGKDKTTPTREHGR